MGDLISNPALESTLSLFNIFFLISFNSMCYARYTRFYELVSEIRDVVQLIASLSATHMRMESQRFEYCRFVLATAMVTLMRATPDDMSCGDSAGYALTPTEWSRLELSEVEWLSTNPGAPKGRFVVGGHIVCEDRFNSLTTAAVLTTQETVLLEKFPTKAIPLVLHAWAVRAIRAGIEDTSLVENPQSGQVDQAALQALYAELRGPLDTLLTSCNHITHELAMPVPFSYFHAVVLLTNVSNALLTLTLLRHDSLTSPLFFFVYMIITTGLRELSAMFSLPFGRDDVDLPVNEIICEMRCLVGMMCFGHEVHGGPDDINPVLKKTPSVWCTFGARNRRTTRKLLINDLERNMRHKYQMKQHSGEELPSLRGNLHGSMGNMFDHRPAPKAGGLQA